MSIHSKYSPSKLHWLKLCPGWQSDPTPGEAAERGTRIHSLITIGEKGKGDEEAPVLFACNTICDIRVRFPDHSIDYEIPVDTGVEGVSGTADFISVSEWETVGVLVDWKTGWGDRDEAADNLQLHAYALGASRKWPHVEKWILIIAELDKGFTTETEIDKAGLVNVEKEIKSIIANIGGTLCPSPNACQYCAARMDCPARMAIVKASVDVEPIEKEKIAQLPAETIGRLLDKYAVPSKMVAAYYGDLQNRAMKIIMGGGEVKGWTIKESNGPRAWTVPDEMICKALEENPICLTEMASPSEIEKRLIATGMKKKEAGQVIAGICASSKRKSLQPEKE